MTDKKKIHFIKMHRKTYSDLEKEKNNTEMGRKCH